MCAVFLKAKSQTKVEGLGKVGCEERKKIKPAQTSTGRYKEALDVL
jgi:hypothetical protein